MLSDTISEAIGDEKSLERIRPDLNIEKWTIWQPAKSKNAPRVRRFERKVTLSDGSRLTAQVEVGFTHEGTLTTEHQKAYYALVKSWEDEGRPIAEDGHLYLRQFTRLLKKGWGTNTRNRAIQCLLGLRSVPFTWVNSYYNAATGETVEKLTRFTILSKLEVFSRKDNPESYHGAITFRFDENILDCLANDYTKPLVFDTAISFKSEVAQILYPHVDLLMADKHRYERRTKEFFDDLGLRGKRYAYPSVRKQVLEPALKELADKPLSTGVIAKAALERTSDGKDYKVVFVKSKRVSQRRSVRRSIEPHEPALKELAQALVDRKVSKKRAAEIAKTCPEERIKEKIGYFDSGVIETPGGLCEWIEENHQPTKAQERQAKTAKRKKEHEELQKKAEAIREERIQEALKNFSSKDAWVEEFVESRKRVREQMRWKASYTEAEIEELRETARENYPVTGDEKVSYIRRNSYEYNADMDKIIEELKAKSD